MPKHIGIVACSAEGAALCYRTICNEGPALMGPHMHPEISMHGHCLAEYMDFIYRDEGAGKFLPPKILHPKDLRVRKPSPATRVEPSLVSLYQPNSHQSAASQLVTGNRPRATVFKDRRPLRLLSGQFCDRPPPSSG